MHNTKLEIRTIINWRIKSFRDPWLSSLSSLKCNISKHRLSMESIRNWTMAGFTELRLQQTWQGKGLFHMCHIQILQAASSCTGCTCTRRKWSCTKDGRVEAMFQKRSSENMAQNNCKYISECKKQESAKLCNKQDIQRDILRSICNNGVRT